VLAVLVVGAPAESERDPPSSVELLHARDADEAVEKLGRNRRIDAVLVLPGVEAASAVAAIRDDVLAPPPIFLPARAEPLPGTRMLAAPATDREELLRLVAEELEGSGPPAR
jgi:hypothetical protein